MNERAQTSIVPISSGLMTRESSGGSTADTSTINNTASSSPVSPRQLAPNPLASSQHSSSVGRNQAKHLKQKSLTASAGSNSSEGGIQPTWSPRNAQTSESSPDTKNNINGAQKNIAFSPIDKYDTNSTAGTPAKSVNREKLAGLETDPINSNGTRAITFQEPEINKSDDQQIPVKSSPSSTPVLRKSTTVATFANSSSSENLSSKNGKSPKLKQSIEKHKGEKGSKGEINHEKCELSPTSPNQSKAPKSSFLSAVGHLLNGKSKDSEQGSVQKDSYKDRKSLQITSTPSKYANDPSSSNDATLAHLLSISQSLKATSPSSSNPPPSFSMEQIMHSTNVAKPDVPMVQIPIITPFTVIAPFDPSILDTPISDFDRQMGNLAAASSSSPSSLKELKKKTKLSSRRGSNASDTSKSSEKIKSSKHSKEHQPLGNSQETPDHLYDSPVVVRARSRSEAPLPPPRLLKSSSSKSKSKSKVKLTKALDI